jgi:hypothetical protein
MTDNFTPLMRVVVAAALLLATATLMLVAVKTARAFGLPAADHPAPVVTFAVPLRQRSAVLAR